MAADQIFVIGLVVACVLVIARLSVKSRRDEAKRRAEGVSSVTDSPQAPD